MRGTLPDPPVATPTPGPVPAPEQNGISIGPLATTRMYCGGPGVMDQETVYLANLQSAASYQVMTDGKLQFMDGNGTPVLVYTS